MKKKVSLYLMNTKGLGVLEAVRDKFGPEVVAEVIGAEDKAIQNDSYSEIKALCAASGIRHTDRKDLRRAPSSVVLAVGWRWLIDCDHGCIVLHDSVLPRYRGYAPLVSSLINGEPEIGVTAFLATEEFDSGPVLASRSTRVSHPIRVAKAIQTIVPLYQEVACQVIQSIQQEDPMTGEPQDHSLASYCLWLDEDDYRMNWNRSSDFLQRFVYAVGNPYTGAITSYRNQTVVVTDAEVVTDVDIVNRVPGKVGFLRHGYPTVVCGTGLLRLTRLSDSSGGSLLPWTNLRSRFV